MQLFVNFKLLLSILSFIFLEACNTGQKISSPDESSQTTIILIDLKEGLNAKFLKQTYDSFNLQKILISNKTLNQYSAKHIGKSEELQKLITALEKDKSVLKVQIQDSGLNSPYNTTNDKKVKTSPKTKN